MSLESKQQMKDRGPLRKRGRSYSVQEVGFFEGAEKLLEVWFDLSRDPQPRDACSEGLRTIPRQKWEEILELVRCKILSSCSNDVMDAYLLSESSMLVSSNRFILKTCGTTTLLYAIKPVISLVQEAFPKSTVMDIFYSHRNFQQPHLQSHPHQSFEEEVHYLDTIFKDGAAYVLGRINGDAWYLYTVENMMNPLDKPDQTLEILMTELDPGLLSMFSTSAYSSAEELTADVGLTDLVPGAILDARLFEPCGYSLNAIVKGDTYFTVHVTPQVECSYVSFETNLEEESYDQLIAHVISLFQPRKCTLTLFANKTAKCGLSFTAFQDHSIRGYVCRERQFSSFLNYNLTFTHYTRGEEPQPHAANGQCTHTHQSNGVK